MTNVLPSIMLMAANASRRATPYGLAMSRNIENAGEIGTANQNEARPDMQSTLRKVNDQIDGGHGAENGRQPLPFHPVLPFNYSKNLAEIRRKDVEQLYWKLRLKEANGRDMASAADLIQSLNIENRLLWEEREKQTEQSNLSAVNSFKKVEATMEVVKKLTEALKLAEMAIDAVLPMASDGPTLQQVLGLSRAQKHVQDVLRAMEADGRG